MGIYTGPPKAGIYFDRTIVRSLAQSKEKTSRSYPTKDVKTSGIRYNPGRGDRTK